MHRAVVTRGKFLGTFCGLVLIGCSGGDAETTAGTEPTTGSTTSVGTMTMAATTETTESSAGPDSETQMDSDSTGPVTDTDASTSVATTDTSSETESDSDEQTTGPIEPDPHQEMLELYAPRVWFPADEAYWPSSVEFAFPYLERFTGGDDNYWLRTIEPLDAPSDSQPFFAGDLAGAPVYGYWADKGMGVVDLVYFMWYPYNRGKEVADTVWGNHVGDWEHITVRLLQNDDESYSPSQVYLSAHSFGGAYDWGGEVALHDGTHPIVYSAWGSHGLWSSPGDHVYMELGEEVLGVCVTLICAELTDNTSAGVAWDTWENVYGMDYGAQEGLEDATWPVWMNDDFVDPGMGDPSVPGMGPIYRWGNSEDCSVLDIPLDITDLIGICRLEDGPTGPVSKGVWGAELQ